MSKWSMMPLGKVVTIKGGGTPSKGNRAYWGGDIPWVSPKDMKTDQVSSSLDTITEEGVANSSVSVIPQGSVLLVVRSGILSRTIPISIAGTALTINQDLKALIPSDKLLPEFLYYFLKSCESSLLQRVTRSATVHRLTSDIIKNLPIPVPEITEQERIVAILDDLRAETSRLESIYHQKLSALIELRESLLQKAFHGELTADRADAHDRVNAPLA
ncbi:restriction endonuclease subunit S [Lentisalinibacter orientalis]|uniref:restriction endonuclease subunit S n=1 Tax=Lentisalinibacter orientalis TaxID=2992241 RepID=UPI003868B290